MGLNRLVHRSHLTLKLPPRPSAGAPFLVHSGCDARYWLPICHFILFKRPHWAEPGSCGGQVMHSEHSVYRCIAAFDTVEPQLRPVVALNTLNRYSRWMRLSL